jgi:SpoVK/Ycf46/Vps4 family AAA+-type ATPase
MIKLEAFVDDKKIAAVLHALDGLVLNLTVVPVHNAKAKGKKVAEAGQPTTGKEVVLEAIRFALQSGQRVLSRKGTFALSKTYGMSKATIATAFQNAVHKDKLLKRQSTGIYLINKPSQITGV